MIQKNKAPLRARCPDRPRPRVQARRHLPGGGFRPALPGSRYSYEQSFSSQTYPKKGKFAKKKPVIVL
jgi:hypothetical protein